MEHWKYFSSHDLEKKNWNSGQVLIVNAQTLSGLNEHFYTNNHSLPAENNIFLCSERTLLKGA